MCTVAPRDKSSAEDVDAKRPTRSSSELHEFVDLGDQVVVVTDLLGRGRQTGADVRGAYAFLWTFREGRAVDIREYATKEEALEAAGLLE